jgi:FkbM family methyltransferase
MNLDNKQTLGALNDSAIRSVLYHLNDQFGSKVTFFQIGGNDGKRGDPINSFAKRYTWSGVIAEPVPEYFERLINEYEFSLNIYCHNVAISNSDGQLEIFFVKFADVPRDRPWEQGLASLDKQHLLNNNVATDRITSTIVPVKTSDQILGEYKGIFLNLLVVDVEGHEEQILSSFPWERYMPECIIFESKHIDYTVHNIICDNLKSLGYSAFKLLNDTIAIRRCPLSLSTYLNDLQRVSG